MTTDVATLKASLGEAINKWANDNCETEGWGQLEVYVHDDFAQDMTDAAFAVLHAMAKSQKFAKEQG